MRILVTATLVLSLALAQTTADKVTQLAAQHPAFASVLAAREGYTSAAYNTQNAYGIWRVQFWEAEGAFIGWIDVEPEREKVYAWHYDVGVTDLEQSEAQAVIFELLKNHGDFINLVGDFAANELKVNYNQGQAFWIARVDRGPDTVAVTLRPEQARVRSLDNLQIETIYFPNTISFEDWRSGNEASIVALAFRHGDIAKALRGNKNWTSAVEMLGDALWRVNFQEGDKLLASATVDLEQNLTTEVEIVKP